MSIFNQTYEESLKILNDYLPIRKNKAGSNGEVFTPHKIIEEKFDILEKENPKIFKSLSAKFLDPCNGIGNYNIVLYHRLMNRLKGKLPNKRDRHNHIIKKMLFMVEIDDRNYSLSRKIFGKDANIYMGNFMENDWVSKFKSRNSGMIFDVIMANPPYNENGIKNAGTKNYYVPFIEHSMRYLKDGGYLLTIHPPGWRIPGDVPYTNINLNHLYTTRQIIYARFYPYHYVKYNIFDSLINVDIVILENKKVYKDSIIVDYHNVVSKQRIKSDMVLVNSGISVFEKMRRYISKNGKLTLLNSSYNHATNGKDGNYPNIHTLTDKIVSLKYKRKHPDQNTPKLFVNGMGMYNRVYYDKKGEYGATQVPFYLPNPRKEDIIFFESKLFQYVCNALKIKGNNLSKPIINQFLPKFKNIKSEGDLYKVLGLTKNEITIIEGTKLKNTPMNFGEKKNTPLKSSKKKKTRKR
jgi:hypothetical protein